MFRKAVLCLQMVTLAIITACPAFSMENQADEQYGFIEPGVEYSTGDYGTDEDTDVFSIPITVGYSPVRRLELYVTFVPLMYMKTTNLLAVSGRPVYSKKGHGHMGTPSQTQEEDTDRDSETGIGDTTVGFTYYFLEQTELLPKMHFSASVKLPTADEDKYLGTGEFDYIVELGAAKDFGPWGVFGSVEYNFIGDPGSDYDLDDYAGITAGVSYRPMDRLKSSLYVYAAEAISDESDDQLEIGFRTSYSLTHNSDISAYVARGLQDGSPDWQMGLYLCWYF